jgi:uncharacterized protein (DUF58 family)
MEFLMHILKHRAVIFFISDFIGRDFDPDALRVPLGVAARKHDMVVISINDPREYEIPAIGLVEFEDLETGEICAVDTRDRELRRDFSDSRKADDQRRDRLLKSLSIDSINLSTAEDFTPRLHRFFQARARRYR